MKNPGMTQARNRSEDSLKKTVASVNAVSPDDSGHKSRGGLSGDCLGYPDFPVIKTILLSE